MGRRFITSRDIGDLLARGERELVVDATTVLTDLARELARDRDVRVTVATGPRGVGDRATERPPAAAATTSDSERPSRRRLRAAVRAAVVEELQTTPPGVDAAIGRVLDRFGIED